MLANGNAAYKNAHSLEKDDAIIDSSLELTKSTHTIFLICFPVGKTLGASNELGGSGSIKPERKGER